MLDSLNPSLILKLESTLQRCLYNIFWRNLEVYKASYNLIWMVLLMEFLKASFLYEFLPPFLLNLDFPKCFLSL